MKATAESYKRKVEEIVRCAVCQEVPRGGPTLQCASGHLCCDECHEYDAIKICPQCTAPLEWNKRRARVMAVEQVKSRAENGSESE